MFGSGAQLAIKLAIIGIAALVVGGLALTWAAPRTDYATGVRFVVNQPVPFSHEHHVAGLGLDCRYCHYTVETSATAGMPTTDTCMACHSQIWTTAGILAPVRQSYARSVPIHWQRIYNLPDYVFFDHSIHIAKGVGCESCHGRLDRMPLTHKVKDLSLSWCLSCHRDPAPNLRPPDEVFAMGWQRVATTPSPEDLMRRYHVRTTGLTDCTVCHR
jgi:hypothetical protein